MKYLLTILMLCSLIDTHKQELFTICLYRCVENNELFAQTVYDECELTVETID